MKNVIGLSICLPQRSFSSRHFQNKCYETLSCCNIQLSDVSTLPNNAGSTTSSAVILKTLLLKNCNSNRD